MRSVCWLVCLVVVVLFALETRAEPTKVNFIMEWKGSVDDEAMQKLAPECITTQKALEKLWTAWRVPARLPKIDFTKEMVVVVTAGGSRLDVSARLDDKGNLDVLGLATLDAVPGFRYFIATVSRDGVKTVNKK